MAESYQCVMKLLKILKNIRSILITFVLLVLLSLILINSRLSVQLFSPMGIQSVTNMSLLFFFGEKSPLSSNLTSPIRDLPQAASLSRIANSAKVKDVDCQAVFQAQINATKHALNVVGRRRKPLGNDFFINATKDCAGFQSSRGYIMSSLTKEEEDFPIAYSMLVFKEIEMIERLLRAIYRPQNFYCIHVDKKSPQDFHEALKRIARCFPNVFLASRRIDVIWGRFSVLQPEIVCMEDLWKYKTWKYFINLTGQEFPLKTNTELVKILTVFKGANAVHGTAINADLDRWEMVEPPPHGIRPLKGSVHVAVNREFVDYILHNESAQEFLNWTARINFADETFFASLNHNPQLGIKGSYLRDPDSTIDGEGKPFFTRYKIWMDLRFCSSKNTVRGICILSTGDLKRLCRSQSMFANKFYFDEDPVVVECLEERIFNNTRDEYMGSMTFDASIYANQDFVLHQVV